MSETTWTFDLDGQPHRATLRHRRLSGLREIEVDGQRLLRQRTLLSRGWRHEFDLDGHHMDLAGMVVEGNQYEYFLLRDGEPLPSQVEAKAGVTAADLKQYTGMGHAHYWEKLAQATKLDTIPRHGTHFWYRHRLLGRGNNRLLSVQLEQPFGSKVYVSIKAHFPPRDDYAGIKEKLLADERLTAIMDGKPATNRVGVAPAHMGIFLPYEPQFETAADLAQRIRDFADLVGHYSQPLPANWCAECQKARPVRLAVMNDFPVQMCDDCLEERRAWGDAVQAENAEIDGRTRLSLLAGLFVALWGGVLWALITAAFAGDERSLYPLLAALIAPLTLAVVIRVLYTISRKPVAWLWTAATGFVLLGLVVAQGAATIGRDYWTARGFSDAGIQNLPVFLFLAILFTIWYGWRGGRNQKKHLASLFSPEIEVISSPPVNAPSASR
ncbi:MAG: hypothetical protein H6650_06635 [Ardenticatenales bacterium]|nr:hypothetical protein [Ardenticatenales bacterium]